MAATGAAPIYFDFNAFEEIQITTGAADASQQTGGININLVTRSGSNVFKGSGQVLFANKNLQSQNVTEELFNRGGTGRVKSVADRAHETRGRSEYERHQHGRE